MPTERAVSRTFAIRFPLRRTGAYGGRMAPISPPGAGSDNPETYVGLNAQHAEQRAREQGWRTVRSLPPGAIITMEYLEGRLNFEVTDGSVTRCWKG